MKFQITSTGLCVPERVETAEELAPKLGCTPEWIREATGVARRHVSDEPWENMAAAAGRDALGSGPNPDLVINASTTPRQVIPDSSIQLQEALGFEGIPSHTVHATCLSFLVALHTAGALVTAGAYRRILVVSAELGSVARNLEEPESAALLGDGAAAAVVEPTPQGESSELLAWCMRTWPSGAHLATLRGGGVAQHPNDPTTTHADNLFHMDGPGIYKMARRRVAVLLLELLEQTGMTRDDLDLIVPHQASGPALAALSRYGFSDDVVVNLVGEYGNCIAASLPMALARAERDGRLHRGMRVLLIGTGAGLSVGGAVIRW